MKGAKVPYWAIALEAANGDPLRAAEIEDKLSQRWFDRYIAYHNAKAAANKNA